MKRNDRKLINLLELTPAQRVPWETAENGGVVLLVPKFRNVLVVKWLVPHLKYPNVRVKLDTMGSFVWKQCDGRTTVAEIADRMNAEFGDSATAAHDRIRTFLLTLEKSDLVNLYDNATSVQQR
jgi:hypothetical protein